MKKANEPQKTLKKLLNGIQNPLKKATFLPCMHLDFFTIKEEAFQKTLKKPCPGMKNQLKKAMPQR